MEISTNYIVSQWGWEDDKDLLRLQGTNNGSTVFYKITPLERLATVIIANLYRVLFYVNTHTNLTCVLSLNHHNNPMWWVPL